MVEDEAAKPYLRGELPAVFAFWHGRMMMMPMICPPKRKMHVLISSSRDGELIARTMEYFGVGAVRGSTTYGGAMAAASAVRALKAGDNVSVTPDGPKGPRMRLQPGLLTIAELAGVPVVPVTYSTSRHKRLRSWDGFMLALPFGTIYYKVGAPMNAPVQEALETQLRRMTEEVDRADFDSLSDGSGERELGREELIIDNG